MSGFKKKQKKLVRHLSMPLVLLLCFQMNLLYANNLGVEGSVYQIVEPDMLTGIHQKLALMQSSGELARRNKAVIARTIQHILRPEPASGVSDLPKGKKPLVHYFDPTMVLNKDIKTIKGDVIAHKGSRVNPLDVIHFDETLIFLNGDNIVQVHWAKHLIKNDVRQQKRFKIILVRGDINETAKALHHRVYFDQHGSLCHHFNIRHTPTRVFQPRKNNGASKVLLVQEMKID